MFVPRIFKITDMNEIREFMEKTSFATIVSTEQGKPIATHLPLELRQRGEDYYLTGHMAYNNPHWKTFEGGNDNILVMYQGPHAYISSSWYKREGVPTWNYQSVHVYGTASIMSEEELEEELILQLQKHEQGRDNPVLWEKLSPRTKKMMKAIVGFKVKVEEVQAKYKLSQNKTEEDYNHIIDKLLEEEDLNSHKLAEEMKRKDVVRATLRCGKVPGTL